MKTEALKEALDLHRFDVAIGGARRDEEMSRAKERVFSVRAGTTSGTRGGRGPSSGTSIRRARSGGVGPGLPLSSWTELDVWLYILVEKIPVVPLYFAAPRPVVDRDGTLLMLDDDRLGLCRAKSPDDPDGPLPDAGMLATHRRGRIDGSDGRGGRPRARQRAQVRAPGAPHRPRRVGLDGAEEAGGLLLTTAPLRDFLRRTAREPPAVPDGRERRRRARAPSSEGSSTTPTASTRTSSRRPAPTRTARVSGLPLDFALLVDGLKAEREQGITIDVAYRYFSTPRRKFIIADAPGHEQFTRNMATAASDVRPRRPPRRRPPRRRHADPPARLHRLAPRDPAPRRRGQQDGPRRLGPRGLRGDPGGVHRFAARLEAPDMTFLPLSALTGENVVRKGTSAPWYQGPPLLEHLETVHVASDRNLVDLRLPVQTVLRPPDGARACAGTIASGIVRVGDEVAVLPSLLTSRITKILGPSGDLAEAFAPMAVAVSLEDELDVGRGDVFSHPGNLPSLPRPGGDARLDGRDAAGDGPTVPAPDRHLGLRGPVSALRYAIDVTTLRRVPAGSLGPNEIGRVALSLTRAVPHDPYARNRSMGALVLRTPPTTGFWPPVWSWRPSPPRERPGRPVRGAPRSSRPPRGNASSAKGP